MPEKMKGNGNFNNKDLNHDITLILEIIKAFWRWKLIILIGVVTICVLTAIISYGTEMIYRVEMVLTPGVIGVDDIGRVNYIDKPVNIRSLISSGVFNKKISVLLKKNGNFPNVSNRFDFIVKLTKGSNPVFRIYYETPDIDRGKTVLNLLFKLIEETYAEPLLFLKNKSEIIVTQNRNELNNLTALEKNYGAYLEYYNKRIQELTAEMEIIKKNSEFISETGAKAVSENTGGSDALISSLVYSNAIQQSQILLSSHRDEIAQYELKITEKQELLNALADEIRNTSTEISLEESSINHLKAVRMIQQPLGHEKPVKPKILANVVMAAIVGFVFMILLVFSIDFVRKIAKR